MAARAAAGGRAAPARPPAVLANCLDLADLPPRAPPAGRAPLLLFAGRVVRDKGADAFVEACARALPRLPGWRAEMIGADRFSPCQPRDAVPAPAAPARGGGRRDARGLPAARGGAGRDGRRRDRRGAEPLAGAVRPDRAGGDGERSGAGVLRSRRAAGNRGRGRPQGRPRRPGCARRRLLRPRRRPGAPRGAGRGRPRPRPPLRRGAGRSGARCAADGIARRGPAS